MWKRELTRGRPILVKEDFKFAAVGSVQALGRWRIGALRNGGEKGDGTDLGLTSLRIGADSLITTVFCIDERH